VVVRRTAYRSPRLIRVTLAGPELVGFGVDQPASSVRLLLPSIGADGLEMPTWTGNEFLLSDGRRPVLRTLTPRRSDASALELDVEIVVHDGGIASRWAETAQPGDPVALSGPGRGYILDPDAPALLLAGDETAIPAISQLLEQVPAGTPVQVDIELADPAGRLALPDHPHASVCWSELPAAAPAGDALVAAVRAVEVVPGMRVWVAGEAAAVQRVRRYLFEERNVPRSHAWVRGYWKRGRSGEAEDDG